MHRCHWVTTDPLYIDYHDKEWGVPVFDNRLLFEFLILEGAQAGLSWITVLKKREQYRKRFHAFNIEKIARMKESDVNNLLTDAGIIRNRLKVESTIINAKACLALKEQNIQLSDYLWDFVNHKPIQNNWKQHKDIPTHTDISNKLSKDLKRRGFKFIGTTICYAFMQAIGMVNDHTTNCFRHADVKKISK